MADDPTLLVLVIDDPLAPRVLGAWKALGPPLESMQSAAAEVTRLARAPRVVDVLATLERCRKAGLILSGGISPTADKWLRSIVVRRLGAQKR